MEGRQRRGVRRWKEQGGRESVGSGERGGRDSHRISVTVEKMLDVGERSLASPSAAALALSATIWSEGGQASRLNGVQPLMQTHADTQGGEQHAWRERTLAR